MPNDGSEVDENAGNEVDVPVPKGGRAVGAVAEPKAGSDVDTPKAGSDVETPKAGSDVDVGAPKANVLPDEAAVAGGGPNAAGADNGTPKGANGDGTAVGGTAGGPAVETAVAVAVPNERPEAGGAAADVGVPRAGSVAGAVLKAGRDVAEPNGRAEDVTGAAPATGMPNARTGPVGATGAVKGGAAAAAVVPVVPRMPDTADTGVVSVDGALPTAPMPDAGGKPNVGRAAGPPMREGTEEARSSGALPNGTTPSGAAPNTDDVDVRSEDVRSGTAAAGALRGALLRDPPPANTGTRRSVRDGATAGLWARATSASDGRELMLSDGELVRELLRELMRSTSRRRSAWSAGDVDRSDHAYEALGTAKAVVSVLGPEATMLVFADVLSVLLMVVVSSVATGCTGDSVMVGPGGDSVMMGPGGDMAVEAIGVTAGTGGRTAG